MRLGQLKNLDLIFPDGGVDKSALTLVKMYINKKLQIVKTKKEKSEEDE